MKINTIFILLILVSCKTTEKNNIINEPPIITSDTLIHQCIKTEDVFGSALCMFLIDSTLFIEDHFNRDTSIWGFHIGQQKVTVAYARKGRGPGEILSPSSNIQYNSQKNSFTLYDPNYKKIIEYNLKDTNTIEYKLPFRDSIFKNNFVQDIIKIDSFYICMGTGGSFTKGKRFLIFDRNYHLIKEIDGYPQINNISQADMAEICQYGDEIHVKPDGSKFVFGSYIGGFLEIFDLQHIPDSIPLLQRNIYYTPIYEKNKLGIITLSEKTIYGFENIYVTDNAIYTLLFEYDKPEIIFPKKMVVYDWDGKWIKSYSLDCMVHGLCVDETQQKIYAMAFSKEESFHLVCFNLTK